MLHLARVIHIVVGVFWAGTVFFNAWLLAPALRDLGPDGGKVMGALAKRGMLMILPVAGILTILSGVKIDIAVAHQGMAALLLAAMVVAAHRLGEARS